MESSQTCPHCASQIDSRAKVCPVCRRDLEPVRRSGGGTVVVWALIIVLAGGCCVVGAVVGLPALVAMMALASPANEAEAVATATPAGPVPSFLEIQEQFDRLTDAQWHDYAATLVGRRVIDWRGQVLQVDEGEILGGFTVFVDMPGADFLNSVYIDVPEEVALRLQKDQAIVFSGDITRASNAFGLIIRLDNAAFEGVDAER